MVTQRSGGFEDGFLDLVEEQLKRCRQELADIDRDVTRLQEQRADAAKRVAQLEGLLHGNRPPDEEEGAEPSLVPTPKPRGPIADADAVVSLIRENGGPMHYLEIHRTFVDRGYQIGGEGNAATLLSRYSKDPRLNRVARGIYDAVDRHPDPAKDLAWNEKGETIQLPPEDNPDGSWETRSRHSPPDSGGGKPAVRHNPPSSRLTLPEFPSRPTRRLSSRMTVADQIAECLTQAGEPLHLQDITERLLRGGWKTTGKSPKQVVSAAIVNEGKFKGEHSRFRRPSRGVIALKEWST